MKKSLSLFTCLMAVLLAGAGTASAQVTLSASPAALSFAAQPGDSPMAQILTVGATSQVHFTVATTTVSGGAWLTVGSATGQTPAYVFVLATPGSLPAGVYYGTVTITPQGVAGSPLSVPVTLTLGGATTGQLAAAPVSLNFSYVTGGATPLPQNLVITSTTIAQVTFTASITTGTGANWLTVNPSGGTTPANLAVAVDPVGLALGTHSGTITLTPVSAVGGSLQVPVTLTVSGAPQLSASPSPVTFYYQIGQTAPAQKTVSLASGGVPVVFATMAGTTSGGSWLAVSPSAGITPSDLTVGVSAAVVAGLPAGTYLGSITVTAPQASNSPLSVPVTLIVSPNPFLIASPASLSFTMLPAGSLPAGQNLSVGSTGTPLPFTVTAWTATSGVNWISASPTGGITPAAVAVSVNSAALVLPPGDYTGTVTLTPTIMGIPQVTIPVTLTVSSVPALTISPSAMVFNYQTGKVPPAIQTVEVQSTGVPANFTAQATTTTGGNWLFVSAASGTTPATLSVAVNPAGLAVGTAYQGSVKFTPAGGGAAQTLQVTLNVSNTPLMNVSPGALSFDFVLGSAAPKFTDVALTSTGDPLDFTVTWTTASGGANWLAVAPSAGATPANLTVFVIGGSLPLGTYSGSVTVTATGANTYIIPVTVTVTSGVSLVAAPTALSFAQALGGAPPAAQKLSVASGGTIVHFTASATTSTGGNWLLVTPLTGSTPADLSVTVSASGLPLGTYYGTITIVSPEAANSPLHVPVTFAVGAAQTISVSPAALQFSYQVGAPAPAAQKVAVASTGGSLNFTAAATAAIGSGWLSVTPASGSTPADLSVSVSTSALGPGTYNGSITVASPSAANSPQTVSVTLTVTAAPPPQPFISMVANAASYARGALAVGEIVYLEGTDIGPPTLTTLRVTGGRVDTLLADTRILFDGIAAPLIYVSSTKSSAVVPYLLAGRASTRVEVEYKGVRSSSIDFILAPAAPGIFALDASGRGQGAILNQDYSVNGPNNRAPKGSAIMIYATGEGQLTLPVADGSITPGYPPFPEAVLPVSVTIGGRTVEPFYKGPAPNFVAGVFQVNVFVPDDIASGPAVPVVITVGGASSQANLTMAVR